MTESERQKIWDEFLDLWPVKKVHAMTLPDYTAIATPDCFTACLESKTQNLGSIWGGNAFKFGIFRRNADDVKDSDSSLTYGSEYAWRTKLGSTPEEAFATVKKEVIRIIDAIQAGNLAAIQSDALWPMVAWKIAFLYQNRDKPLVVAVFKSAWIKAYLGLANTSNLDMAALNRLAMEKRGTRGLLEYSREIWEQGAEAEKRAGGDSAPAQSPASEAAVAASRQAPAMPLNCILYGPPGTGKTYSAVTMALQIFQQAGVDIGNDRAEQLACFERLRANKHIQFVTFHQSFSYEDFVEGIRPMTKAGALQYDVEFGIFKKLCDDARKAGAQPEAGKDAPARRVWKMSLGNTLKDDGWVFEECKKNSYLLMGYGDDIDFSACKTVEDIRALFEQYLPEQIEKNQFAVSEVFSFVVEMQAGELIVISEGNSKFRAIGRVLDNYRVIDREGNDYRQCRDVEWLHFYVPAQPVELIYSKMFSQQTLYKLTDADIKREALDSLLADAPKPQDLPYVLIIDEINRGNLAAIFGELITLIEDTHRANGTDPLTLTLPYSKKLFSVPGNVYIIGTMNTADRSLTRLDTALRRRFSMLEMPPQPDLLKGIHIPSTQVSLADILTAMNERIAVLLDSDHCIGHAPFMKLSTAQPAERLEELKKIFLGYIVPLLEEYFFDDWQKIRLVLNDHNKQEPEQMLRQVKDAEKLFGADRPAGTDGTLWAWNKAAFGNPLAYAHIYVAAPAVKAAVPSSDAESGAPV